MDHWIEDAADEAIRKVYLEHLAERFANDPTERQHREQRFDTGHPHPADQGAINKGRQAFIQAYDTGTATDAARDAFYGEFDRQEIKKKEADPNRYSNDADYRQRMDVLIAKGVEERRQARCQADRSDIPPALAGPSAELLAYALGTLREEHEPEAADHSPDANTREKLNQYLEDRNGPETGNPSTREALEQHFHGTKQEITGRTPDSNGPKPPGPEMER